MRPHCSWRVLAWAGPEQGASIRHRLEACPSIESPRRIRGVTAKRDTGCVLLKVGHELRADTLIAICPHHRDGQLGRGLMNEAVAACIGCEVTQPCRTPRRSVDVRDHAVIARARPPVTDVMVDCRIIQDRACVRRRSRRHEQREIEHLAQEGHIIDRRLTKSDNGQSLSTLATWTLLDAGSPPCISTTQRG
jgi:hypothetical protein